MRAPVGRAGGRVGTAAGWLLAILLAAAALPARTLDLGSAPPTAAGVVRGEGPAIVKARTAALLLSGLEGGALRVSFRALPVPGEGPARVPVVVDIAGGSRAPDALGPAPERTLELEVHLYAVTAEGEVAGSTSHRLRLEAGALGAGAEAAGIKLLTALELPPGDYDLRLLVQGAAAEGAEFALRRARLSLPATRPACWWVAEAAGSWTLALPAEARLQGVETLPLEASTPGELPATLPVLVAGKPWSAVGLLPAGETDAAAAPSARFSPRRVGGTGDASAAGAGEGAEAPAASFEVPTASLERVPRRLAEDGLAVVHLTFPSLEVPPGAYDLRLGASAAAAPSIPVWVSRKAVPWPRLEGGSDPPETPPLRTAEEPAPSPETGARLPDEEIRAGYRRVLERLVVDVEGAAAALRELEDQAFDPAFPEGLEEIEAAEWSVIAALLDRAPEAMPPVMMLHARVARQRRGGSAMLADHAHRQAARLAEAYAAAPRPSPADPAAAPALAARVLASLGSDRQQEGRVVTARELFRRSLLLDGEQPAVLLALAALEEQAGRWGEVVAVLERLVAQEPRHGEGRLRLAVNLLRTGTTKRARRLLWDLAAEAEPRWIVSLAFQELGRFELGRGRCGAAESVLRQAADRFPGQSEIGVLLAYSLECQGRRVAARRLAADLLAADPVTAEAVSPPARFRYTRPSLEGLEAERRRLLTAARDRRGDLERVLAGFPAAVPPREGP